MWQRQTEHNPNNDKRSEVLGRLDWFLEGMNVLSLSRYRDQQVIREFLIYSIVRFLERWPNIYVESHQWRSGVLRDTYFNGNKLKGIQSYVKSIRIPAALFLKLLGYSNVIGCKLKVKPDSASSISLFLIYWNVAYYFGFVPLCTNFQFFTFWIADNIDRYWNRNYYTVLGLEGFCVFMESACFSMWV